MEENENLQKELVEKLEKEYEKYKKDLLEKTNEEIFKASYETTVKQEIIDVLSYSQYDNLEIKAMLKRDDILNEFYHDWLDCDTPLYEAVEDSVQESIFMVLRYFEDKDSNEKEN